MVQTVADFSTCQSYQTGIETKLSLVRYGSNPAANRTKLELKHEKLNVTLNRVHAANRTKLELKL